jgi:hypothetical protein
MIMQTPKSLTVLTLALLAVFVSACGSTEKDAAVSSAVRSTTTMTKRPPGLAGGLGSLPFIGDSDVDRVGDTDTDNNNDNDNDRSQDYKRPPPKSYLDEDDRSVLGFGDPAKKGEKQAIAQVVKRYFAAAAAADGARACTMLQPRLEVAVVKDYAGAAGPTYLRGAKTCPEVMSRLFRHAHDQLTGTIEVTSVRVLGDPTQEGAKAEALLGSDTLPASYVMLERVKGLWRIEGLLSSDLV